MPRLFVAVWPPPEVVDAVHALDVQSEPGVRPVPPENWHVTLRFLGEADPDVVAERLRDVVLPSARASLGPAVERLGGKEYVVPVAGVDELAGVVGAVTADIGMPARRRFVGHLTVALAKRGAASAALGREIDVEFVVDRVALVASDLTSSGAVYDTLVTFPTEAADPLR